MAYFSTDFMMETISGIIPVNRDCHMEFHPG